MLIRHAEKPPPKPRELYGVSSDGTRDDGSLTIAGWQRAGALAVLFGSTIPPKDPLAVPGIIFASAPANGGSKRPLQTVTSLAAKLGSKPNVDFGKGQEVELVEALLLQSLPTLVCWQHEHIPKIARNIAKSRATDSPIPAEWPDERFDMVWVFSASQGAGIAWRFSQVPQLLLAGDLAMPFDSSS